MRRLFNWAFNGAAVVSAALFILTCVVWGYSRDAAELAHWARWETPGSIPLARIWWVDCISGRVSASYERIDHGSAQMDAAIRKTTPAGFGVTRITSASYGPSLLKIFDMEAPFAFDSQRRNAPAFGNVVYEIRSPAWFLPLVTAVLPILYVVRLVRQAKRTRLRRCGRCPSCGYDLRATPDKCPECGVIPTTAAT